MGNVACKFSDSEGNELERRFVNILPFKNIGSESVEHPKSQNILTVPFWKKKTRII